MDGCGTKFRGLGALLGALGADGSDDTHIEVKFLRLLVIPVFERFKFEGISVQ
jgi:hypothetical protein